MDYDLAYKRIISSVKQKIRIDNKKWKIFLSRINENWSQIYFLFIELYSERVDLYYHLERIIIDLWDSYKERDDYLLQRDIIKEKEPYWYEKNSMIGASLYVDLFSDNLNSLKDKIDYLKDLGITYLHLMPIFDVSSGNSDGGYAVRDYRIINKKLGSMDDLRVLAEELHKHDIVLVLDFIFNHTSNEHPWAIKAKSGLKKYMDFYYMFIDRSIPDKFEENLREIFPTVRRGNFTWNEKCKRWIWTTFNSFQWDLNYKNPDLFRYILKELLYLINRGVDIFRLDAVAFIWKEMGTNCENLPKAHTVIKTLNLLINTVAPETLFKSEAIVHPDMVKSYISLEECQLSYNPLLMALIWEALATRKTELLIKSIKDRHVITKGCSWCNYLRCHDDIGWTFDNRDAWELGINPDHHRDFLNAFYTGRFPGSFAKGVPFQENRETGDMRISGTLASLAGIEEALLSKDKLKLDNAIKRIKLMYNVILTIGGIPLIYIGDELGLLNDYSYLNKRDKKNDSRWVHRVKMPWNSDGYIPKMSSAGKRINRELKKLIELRKRIDTFSGSSYKLIIEIDNPHTLCYTREYKGSKVVVICNFADYKTDFETKEIKKMFKYTAVKDLYSGKRMQLLDSLSLEPYNFLWLTDPK